MGGGVEHVHIFVLFLGNEQDDSSSPKVEMEEILRQGIQEKIRSDIILSIPLWYRDHL